MPAPKFKAYVTPKGAKEPIEAPEIALVAEEKDVRELAEFLLFVADEMKTHRQNFEHSDAWKTIESALTRLERNGDFKLMTEQEYITGYLCKALSRNGALKIQKIKKRITPKNGTAKTSSDRKN